MTRKMADAVNPFNIPVGVYPLVAGYIDGPISQWSAAGWARHAGHSILVKIAVFESTNAGIVGDSESGDMTPAGLVRWVVRRRAAGVDPTGYCSEGSFTVGGINYGWAACKAAFAAAKVPEPHWWVAAYPGEGQVIPAGAIAHQYVDLGPLDESVVADYWPGVDQGGDMSLELNTPLPDAASVAGTGTVAEGLTTALYGIGGKRNGGALANAVASMQAQLTAIQGALTQEEADLLAAVKGVTAGVVDVKTLAAALAPILAPLLPAGATPAQFVAALGAQLATPSAGGTP